MEKFKIFALPFQNGEEDEDSEQKTLSDVVKEMNGFIDSHPDYVFDLFQETDTVFVVHYHSPPKGT